MTPKLSPDSHSNVLEETYIPSHSHTSIRLEQVAYMLLGRFPGSARDFKALGARLAKAIKRRKSYDGYYIWSIWHGKNPMTPPISKAINLLTAELRAKPPDEDYKKVEVMVPNGVHVPEGTVILRDATTCICGTSFIPTIWNQINHTRACVFMRMKMRSRK